MRTYLDLLLFLGITLLTAILVSALPEWQSPVRVALGLVVVLAAPGYALMSALFPRSDDIDGVERLALTLGLSIAATPLVGLVLNATPWGIRLVPMAVGLTLFTALFTALAAWRRRRAGPEQAFTWPWGTPLMRQGSLLAAGVMAVLLGVPALAVALRPPEHATEFYVLGSTGQLQSYPTRLEPGEPFTITLGITNHEREALSFRLGIPFDLRYDQARTTVIEPGDRWQRTLELTAPESQGRTRLEFELYRPDDTEPYRSLHLFVTMPGQPPLEALFPDGVQMLGPVTLEPLRETDAGEVATEPPPAAPEQPAATPVDPAPAAPAPAAPAVAAPATPAPAPAPASPVPAAPAPAAPPPSPAPAPPAAAAAPPAPAPAPPAPAPAPPAPAAGGFRTHVVQPGETLFGIAREHLGDGFRYEELFELNRDRLTSPQSLPAGIVLRLPAAP